jgi:hypothetical protein
VALRFLRLSKRSSKSGTLISILIALAALRISVPVNYPESLSFAKSFNLLTLRFETQTTSALFQSANPDVSDCLTHAVLLWS